MHSRAAIRGDAERFAVIATVLIAALLLTVYRSPRLLALGLLPVASGALAGIAAVGVGFGAVHGITLGFGATLIGEGVDYAIYLFTQNAPGEAPEKTLQRMGRRCASGVMTSVCGFSAMLLSGFPGLAQLGLFSITGLLAAVAVTRWVLPALLPQGFTVRAVARLRPGDRGAGAAGAAAALPPAGGGGGGAGVRGAAVAIDVERGSGAA
ncbi:MAG: MMPL family transporter [Comamonadaceae bacterium]|nr:MMPL family transporter [Comamonadaceae bacterium]